MSSLTGRNSLLPPSPIGDHLAGPCLNDSSCRLSCSNSISRSFSTSSTDGVVRPDGAHATVCTIEGNTQLRITVQDSDNSTIGQGGAQATMWTIEGSTQLRITVQVNHTCCRFGDNSSQRVLGQLWTCNNLKIRLIRNCSPRSSTSYAVERLEFQCCGRRNPCLLTHSVTAAFTGIDHRTSHADNVSGTCNNYIWYFGHSNLFSFAVINLHIFQFVNM